MLGLPVGTLRVWERRYGLTQTATTTGGQRLYTAEDVRRLALIKQLTDRGHAIGSLAPLNLQQLQDVVATHAQALADAQGAESPMASPKVPARAWRLAVVGAGLWPQLHKPGVLRRLGRPVLLLGPYDSAAKAAAALQADRPDAVLLHQPQLQPSELADLDGQASAWDGLPLAVIYSFAANAECEALADAGVSLLREPQPDAVVAQWLRSLLASVGAGGPAKAAAPTGTHHTPRRWDDAALAGIAGLTSTVACECPRHVAELLLQLARFEAYSAACEERSPADAALHAHLHQVAGAARARFEAAMEYVALHEGLLLPPQAADPDAA
jgi:DNA-binding transcriptional MerR regulator